MNLHEYVEKNRLPCIILLGEEKISFLSHFVPPLVAAVLEIQSPSCQREREREEREREKKRGSKGKIKGVLLWDGVVLFLLPPTATAARGSPPPLFLFITVSPSSSLSNLGIHITTSPRARKTRLLLLRQYPKEQQHRRRSVSPTEMSFMK